MKKECFFIWFLLLLPIRITSLYAQEKNTIEEYENDSTSKKKSITKRLINYFEEAKKDKSNEKFDLSFIGGPSYSVDTKFGIGILASGLYRLDREDQELPPSDLSIFSNITTSGFFSLGLENHTIFPENKYRINTTLNFAFLPTKYYGVGYEAGNLGEFTKYDQYQTTFQTSVLRKILKNTYAGVNFNLKNINGRKFKNPELQPQDRNSFILGGGLLLTYDSRDFIPNPSKGFYFKYEENFYPSFLGNDQHFREAFLTARTYQPVWTDGILAIDLDGIIKTGDVPWSMMSMIGGSYQMRGYFIGRYRDKKRINAQAELRQKIYNRHGAVAWAGVGTVFDKFREFTTSHLLPNFGIGYRWEFKNRVNVRLDYGFGKNQSGFYFNINEAF